MQDDTRRPPDTRTRILDAARTLVLQLHPAALTVAAIAAAAEVSERTVYRYFPTKGDLIQAVAEWPTERAPNLAMPARWDEVRGALRVHWHWFANNLDVLRSERIVPGGLELRQARLRSFRPQVEQLLADAGMSDMEGSPLVEVLIHLTSSSTLLDLIDRHGMTVDEALDAVLDACDRLVESALQDARS